MNNIEKSIFRSGEYVGYGAGVWRIVRGAGQWLAYDSSHNRTMLRAGLTHSTSDSAYPRTPDGLSIAIARCNYLAKTRKPATIGA